jgi:glycogen(starch) synthase
MKILFWSGTFWPKIGGVEVLAARLLPALQERGHEFMVITPRRSEDQDYEDDFQGIPVHRFDFTDHSTFKDMKCLAATKARIVKLKRAFCADVVHMNALDIGAFFHLITTAEYPAPMLVTLHGGWGDLPPVRDSLISQTLRQADRVIGCSQAILRRGIEFAPESAPRSSVVYNGIDPPLTVINPLATDPPVLLCVGRLELEKGIDIALQAFAEVERSLPGTRFLIVGDGDDRAALEHQAAELGLAGVEFLGWSAPDAVAEVMNQATAVVMPSRADSFPLTALEASMMQRPVIASRVGGLPEIILDGETGLLVEPEHPGELAKAIFRLLGDPEQATRMGKAARERVTTCFSWSGHVDAYDRVYRELGGNTSVEKQQVRIR